MEQCNPTFIYNSDLQTDENASETLNGYRYAVKIVLFSISCSLLLLSCYGFLWVFTSTNLTFSECSGSYTFNHELVRCRQPILGLLLFTSAGLLACIPFSMAYKIEPFESTEEE